MSQEGGERDSAGANESVDTGRSVGGSLEPEAAHGVVVLHPDPRSSVRQLLLLYGLTIAITGGLVYKLYYGTLSFRFVATWLVVGPAALGWWGITAVCAFFIVGGALVPRAWARLLGCIALIVWMAQGCLGASLAVT